MHQSYENQTRQQFAAQAFKFGSMAFAAIFAATVAIDVLSVAQSITLF